LHEEEIKQPSKKIKTKGSLRGKDIHLLQKGRTDQKDREEEQPIK